MSKQKLAEEEKKDLFVEFGGSGTESFVGLLNEDYNPEFTGQKAIEKYEEMRRTDATVNAVLDAMKLPIISAEWSVESSDSKNAKQNEMADFIRLNLQKMEGGFSAKLREILTYLDFGYYYFEKVYKVYGGMIWLEKLAARKPSAHYLWRMQNQPQIPGITQMLPSIDNSPSGNYNPEIPMSKLVLLTHKREGNNYEGVSVLRSAFKHWYFKDLLYKIDGIKHERGAGILLITPPAGISAIDKTKANELGKNFKINEYSHIVAPTPDWKFELLTTGISDQSAALMESVRHHDRMLVTNILAQFLDLGSGNSGSFALSKDQSSFFILSLRSIASYVAGCLNDQLVRELVELNFGEQNEYPRFRFGEIGDVDFGEMSQAIKTLIDSGLVETTPDVKAWAYKTFKLPEKTAEDFEPVEEVIETPIEEPEEGEMSEKRDMTEAEKRVGFAGINDSIDDMEAEAIDLLRKESDLQKEILLRKLANIIETKNIAALTALSLPLGVGLAQRIRDIGKKATEEGKKAAASEIGKTIPTTPGLRAKLVSVRADLQLEQRSAEVLGALKLRTLDLIQSEIGKTQAVNQLANEYDSLSNRWNRTITSKIVVDSMADGRDIVFDTNRQEIHGLQRSELLDSKTCEMCISLDGRVISPTDPFSRIGQIHQNCRGIWVAVLKTDTELPQIKGIPKAISNRFDTLEGVPLTNNFKPLKTPIAGTTSRAWRKGVI